MTLLVRCPALPCRALLSVRAELSGRLARCCHCGAILRVPPPPPRPPPRWLMAPATDDAPGCPPAPGAAGC